MSTDNEEKIEQNRYEDNSTTVEDGIRDSKQETFHKKSKAEKSLQRKIDLLFLPLALCIIMVQVRFFCILGFAPDTQRNEIYKQNTASSLPINLPWLSLQFSDSTKILGSVARNLAGLALYFI